MYTKPTLFLHGCGSEVPFCASGLPNKSSDCWTIDYKVVQDWDGTSKVYEIHCVHSRGVAHISKGTIVTLTLSDTPALVRSEFPLKTIGNQVVITRELLADAFYSGDDVTFKVWIGGKDQISTQLINILDADIECLN